MTTDNKLADALHTLLLACDDSDSAMYGTLGVSFVRDVAQAALAEHDAAKDAQDDGLEKWERLSMETLADALEKRGDDLSSDSATWIRKRLEEGKTVHLRPAPVQPPATGEAELPDFYNLILKAVDDASPRWGDQHDNPMKHQLSRRERECIAGRVFAAIAALQQKVTLPDAVWALPARWRSWAAELKSTGQACTPNSYRAVADELEAALRIPATGSEGGGA